MSLQLVNMQGVVIEPKTFTFPGGELNVTLPAANLKFLESSMFFIQAFIKNSADIMELFLTVDALRRLTNNKPIQLVLPYVPYARQDRVCNAGESLSIKVFCDLINSLNFTQVTIVDPHSEVTPALLNNVKVIDQLQIINNWRDFGLLGLDSSTILVSPDAGANKKVAKIAKYFGHPAFIRADKKRDLQTGEILETVVYADDLSGQTCVIVDDICDAGRTFLELANVLKSKNAKSIQLYVSHGIFSKGVQVLLDGGIDKIWTTNSYNSNFVDSFSDFIQQGKLNIYKL